jgi:hypothetical protein
VLEWARPMSRPLFLMLLPRRFMAMAITVPVLTTVPVMSVLVTTDVAITDVATMDAAITDVAGTVNSSTSYCGRFPSKASCSNARMPSRVMGRGL